MTHVHYTVRDTIHKMCVLEYVRDIVDYYIYKRNKGKISTPLAPNLFNLASGLHRIDYLRVRSDRLRLCVGVTSHRTSST